MLFYQVLLVMISSIYLTLSIYFFIIFLSVFKRLNKHLYFSLLGLGGFFFAFFIFLLTIPTIPNSPGNSIIVEKLALTGLMISNVFLFYCINEICFQGKKSPFFISVFTIFTILIASTIPTPLFVHMPIITIAGSSGFIKYEIKTGTFGISFYIYALGLSAYVIILIFRIFLAKLKISQKLLGYCLLIFLLSASFDISVETGFIKSPLISPFAGLIFVACIFVTFIIEEQQNFKKISDINLYLEEEIARKTAELKEKQDELIVLASTDPLTGLTNRQEFIRQLEMEKKKIDRYGEKSYRTFVLIFIDLDNFKYFNDSFGHDMGDYILKIFSRFLKSNLREVDFIARYGGDEFILLLPYTNMDEAIIVMNRCYNNLKKCDYFDEELKIYLAKENIVFKQKIGFSAGLVMYEKGVDVDDLLKRSDRALYAIKRSSKNNYRIWKPDDQDFLL